MSTADAFIPFAVWGEYDPVRLVWKGKYSAPGVGVAYVRDAAGTACVFAGEDEAIRVASSTRDRKLNDMHRERRMRDASGDKVFRVVKAGRTRLAIGVGR